MLGRTSDNVVGSLGEFLTNNEVDDGRLADTGFVEDDDIWSTDTDGVLERKY